MGAFLLFCFFAFLGFFSVFCWSQQLGLVFALIVSLIFYFANWYNSFLGGINHFFGFFGFFVLSMLILVDVMNYYFLIFRWEMIGVISYFLIKNFFSRDLAQNGSLQAIFLNRFRDFCLFSFLILEATFLGFLGVLAKSSMTVFCSWLPNAIERPTPVSSLLHSSTIVVAGVFILSFLGLYSSMLSLNILLYRTFIRLMRRFFKDFKRVIAYSTSSQLRLIRLFFTARHFLCSMSYVFVHAFFKARLFIFCGLTIHSLDAQLSKFFSNSPLNSRSNFLLVVIVRTPFLSVAFLKDPFLLCARGISLLLRLFFRLSTLFYSFKLFKFFRVGGIFISFRGFLFFALIIISLSNFLELILTVTWMSNDMLLVWFIFFMSAITLPFMMSWLAKAFLVEFFRKFFAFSSNILREFEIKFLLRFSVLTLTLF